MKPTDKFIIFAKTKSMSMETIKVTAYKFFTINGKKTGKAYTFPIDPKAMARYKTKDALLKKVGEMLIESGEFNDSDLKDLRFKWNGFLEEWENQKAKAMEETDEKNDSQGNRTTPDMITQLAPDEIFVFGSNASGLHYGGAAKTAYQSFGAIMGQGEGIQGQSYAIPTMGDEDEMQAAIFRFADYAEKHQSKRFLVTPIGCGIAGYTPEEIAPMFECCAELENVSLPASFWEVIR